MSCKTSRKKSVCRSCIQECSDFKSIYSPRIIMGEHTTLAAVLSYCTGLDFPEDEIFMPPNVCSGCMDSLMNFYAFKRSVIKADQIFRHQHEIGSAKNWHAPVVPSCDLQQEQCTDQTYEVEELKYNMDPLDTQSSNELEDDDDREFTFLEDVQYVDEVDEEEEEEFKVDPPTVNDHKAVKTSKNKGTKRSGDPEVQYETADNYNRSCQASPLVIVKVESEQGRRRPQSDCTPVKCNLCRVVFQIRQDYEGHLCLQNSPSLLKCQICNKTYRRKISLREHMRIHTGADKPYLCYICGKGLTQSSGYKKHMLTHTGEKPYTCDTCGRDFRYSSNLLIHKRRHTGERNYNCTLCSKKFYTSEKLKRHMIVHTHERLFGCEECGISFRFRTMLIDHRRIHEANKKGTAKRKAVKPANFE